MPKVLGPLFSLGASGVFGGSLNYLYNYVVRKARQTARKNKGKVSTDSNAVTEAQALVRVLFSDGIKNWKKMSAEEQFLWELSVKNYRVWGASMSKNVARAARCLYMHNFLSFGGFYWKGSPWPPSLWKMWGKDDIAGYAQMISDLETLTGLSFSDEPNPYFFKYLGTVRTLNHPGIGMPTAGFTTHLGTFIALAEDYYNSLSADDKKFLVTHELTHCIMNQNGWTYIKQVPLSELLADECAQRVVDGDLTPIYTYQGMTLQEIIDFWEGM